MAHTWSPEQYLLYGDERARPFLDLTARLGAGSPRRVVDLGVVLPFRRVFAVGRRD